MSTSQLSTIKFKRGKIRSRIPLGRRLMTKKALEIDFRCTPR